MDEFTTIIVLNHWINLDSVKISAVVTLKVSLTDNTIKTQGHQGSKQSAKKKNIQ